MHGGATRGCCRAGVGSGASMNVLDEIPERKTDLVWCVDPGGGGAGAYACPAVAD